MNSNVDYAVLTGEEQGRLLDLQQSILVSVARGGDPLELINRICRLEEELLPNSVASVMLLDEEHLKVYAAPSMSAEGVSRLNFLRPGPGGGSCGNVIYRKEAQFVSNTFTDARWSDLRQIAHDFNLCSCWSVPVISAGNRIVGTFALSSFEHRSPTPFHRKLLEIGSSIIGIVLERKHDEEALRIAAIAFESQQGMMITDANANILRVNRAFTQITGYSTDDLVSRNPRMLKSGKQGAEFYASMWESIRQNGHWSGEIWDRKKNGEIFPEHLSIMTVKDANGQVTNYVASIVDITERKNAEEKIQQLAYYDQLTGLPNRQLFRDRLEQEIRRVVRNRSSLALLFIDLDRFKEVNDTLGHHKGDLLLVEAARRIRQHVRETDTFARLGGDEFTIILPEYGESTSIERVVQSVLSEMARPFDLGEGGVGHISCSVGIAVYPQDAGSIEDLLKHTDQAMYAAKRGGRNQFSYFTPTMQQKMRERMDLKNDLREALSRGELEVYYQPIVELASGRIEKAEALLRWNHPKLGQVSPALFIPLAEEFGIIHDIGNWVLMQAISAGLDWRERLGREVQVSVNRSPVEFERKGFRWPEMLEGIGAPGRILTMEITEGLLLKDSGFFREQLLECRNSGIEVSIDDFGTGYSALSYLKKFDIDYLKIDRAFIRDLANDMSDKALVEAIIVMAHKLGIRTIAEGVETEVQRDLLRFFGCDYVQGYLYSRPLPSRDFEKLLTAN